MAQISLAILQGRSTFNGLLEEVGTERGYLALLLTPQFFHSPWAKRQALRDGL